MDSQPERSVGPSNSQAALKATSRIDRKRSNDSLDRIDSREIRGKMQSAISDGEEVQVDGELSGMHRKGKEKAVVPSGRWLDRFQVRLPLSFIVSLSRLMRGNDDELGHFRVGEHRKCCSRSSGERADV